MSEIIAVEVFDLSETDAQQLWKQRASRPANFDDFVNFLNARGVGRAFDLQCAKLVGADESHDYAVKLRKIYNEAAKERTAAANGVNTSAPVKIRWKMSSHKEKRTVQDGNKKREIEIEVVDFLHGLIAATAAARGGRNAASENVDAIVSEHAVNLAETVKEFVLPDGRKALRTKAGHWRAPKREAVAAPA